MGPRRWHRRISCWVVGAITSRAAVPPETAAAIQSLILCCDGVTAAAASVDTGRHHPVSTCDSIVHCFPQFVMVDDPGCGQTSHVESLSECVLDASHSSLDGQLLPCSP